MDKTIKYLEDTGFLKRLRFSKNMSEAIFDKLVSVKLPDEAKKETYKAIIYKEIQKDMDLLGIVLDEVSEEIIKHI